MVMTSILPTEVGGEYNKQRIMYLNSEIEKVVKEEGGKFVNLERHFMVGSSINRDLYKNESCGLLHINEKGARIAIHTINDELMKMGLDGIIEDFRRDSLFYNRR